MYRGWSPPIISQSLSTPNNCCPSCACGCIVRVRSRMSCANLPTIVHAPAFRPVQCAGLAWASSAGLSARSGHGNVIGVMKRDARTSETGHEKINILLVDDQQAKLLSYEAILDELGENLIKASSATEALEQLLKRDI